MLILTRKSGETLMIGDEVTVTILGVKGNQVRVGIANIPGAQIPWPYGGRMRTVVVDLDLGFVRGKSPCHATLTETMRAIDARALADILGALDLANGNDARHIAFDGKTMRASKDSDGKAEHVLSAFCCGLQTIVGHEASRGKGLEIPDALKLLERLDLTGKIITGDAIFCQKSIATKIVDRGGDYIFPVKDNQKTLRQDIETAFNEPVFPPGLV